MEEKGFDTEKYLHAQTAEILNRVKKFDNKLYLEFGGKICDDFHAARVLPGYNPNTKITMLKELSNIELISCVSAKDIEEGKIRGDFGLSYDSMTIKLVNDLRDLGLDVTSVVINRFSGESKALKFKKYLENTGIAVYLQQEIAGYPADVDKIASNDGYGKNPYIETSKPIVVVTGAGPGSGKMSTCLSQLYHDSLHGIKSGFAKFETFPIWNLPIDHPVNLAYEAATADIGDMNMIDPFHIETYGITAVNYNRDIENFSIMKNIIEKISSNMEYKSPTDMGVSKAKEGIINDAVVQEAAKQEIIRRYFRYKKESLLGSIDKDAVNRVEKLMQRLGIDKYHRKTVEPARNTALEGEKKKKGNKGFFCGAALELKNGTIITGKNSELLHAESAAILNSIKSLASIPDNLHLLPENIIQNIKEVKRKLAGNSGSLDVSEILIALSISSASNPAAATCLDKLALLKGCEMHITHMPNPGDEAGIRKIGINLTTDATMTPQIYFKK